MDRLMSLRQKAAGFFVRKTRVSASVSNAVASMGIAEWNDQVRSQGHRLLKVPCWDQVSAELGETFKSIRALLLSLGSAGNKVNSSSWARKDKSHWHNVQNSILSRNLDSALWRTNGRCIYIKHEPPPILCLWSTDSFLPGFTEGLPSPISNYHPTLFPLNPYKSPPPFEPSASIYQSVLHPQKCRAPQMLFIFPARHNSGRITGTGLKLLFLPKARFWGPLPWPSLQWGEGKPYAGVHLSYKSREQNKWESLDVRNRKV